MRIAVSLALATFVSEDLAGVSAGVLAANGTLGYPAALGSYVAGIVAGDFLLFLIGRWMGQFSRLRSLVARLVSEDRLARSARWITTRGAQVVIASRFLPGTRVATYVACGFAGVSPWRFLGYLVMAAAAWTPLVVAAGALPASGLLRSGMALDSSGPTANAVAIAVTLIAGAALFRLTISLVHYQPRRAWVGRWRRMTRWEFWPMWCFYPPVIAYVLYLALKHRSLTAFTACNPGIIGGGFVGESKCDILRKIAAVDGCVVPAFTVVPSDAPHAVATELAEAHVARDGFPVVIKPDQGQRGEGVVIARTSDDVQRALGERETDLILQRYVAGCEFGVFYYRHPNHLSGNIFAITEKRLQIVEGDGRRTLERLILDHPRAVAVATHYFRANRDRLEWIPDSGERVQLSELGVHSRGAIFLDGGRLGTPALSDAVDRLARRIEGFHFGRFDVRSPSVEAFMAGHFAVIELNGVTSEATSIYDPQNTLWTAYRVLFAQWRLAFEIGAANLARGATATPLTTLIALLRAYARRRRTRTDRKRHMFALSDVGVRFRLTAR